MISRGDRTVRILGILTVYKKHHVIGVHTGWFDIYSRLRTEEVGTIGLQSDHHEPDQSWSKEERSTFQSVEEKMG